MRVIKTRKSDATFDLNLAPFLDIIVSVIPMLLLSVAFLQIKMIETPIPQVVAEKIAAQDKNEIKVNLSLTASKSKGFVFDITNQGKKSKEVIPLKEGKLDFDKLNSMAITLKQSYTDVFKVDFYPDGNVAYNDIVKTMDTLRRLPAGQKVSFKDEKSGQAVETDLMFPDVTFSNVLGE